LNVLVQLLAHEPTENSLMVPAVAEPLIVWVLSGSAKIEERELDGEWLVNDVTVGDFFLTHSVTPYELRWTSTSSDPFRVMHLYLGVPIYEAAASEVFGNLELSEINFCEISGERDDRLSSILEMIHDELVADHESSEIYVQGVAQALSVHLLRNYANRDPTASRKGALQAFKLRRVIEAMRHSLREDFRLDLFAAEAELSTFHFSRAFKQTTGFSPSDYFIQLRMDEAKRLLRETEMSVLEVSLDVGYSSPSHFAQVFRRQVGVTPSDYRK
jgi:AraC family transcriptional regulator